MRLQPEDLQTLMNSVLTKIQLDIIKANAVNELELILDKYNLSGTLDDVTPSSDFYRNNIRWAKILVIAAEFGDFLSSLQRNISNHIVSLEKCHYESKVVFFLMEQQTARLWIDEGVVPIKFYELHKDKKALSIVKEFCCSVNYLIYLVSDAIEIIDVSKIDDLLEKAIVYKNVKGGRLIKHQINLFFDL